MTMGLATDSARSHRARSSFGCCEVEREHGEPSARAKTAAAAWLSDEPRTQAQLGR
jgi:hypothetical protein